MKDKCREALEQIITMAERGLGLDPSSMDNYFVWIQDKARAALAQPAEPANTPYDEGPFTLTEPAGLSETELPPPQLLVESAQGFVEGWTKSQVRSAINLALLKHRYSQPVEPAPLADEQIDKLLENERMKWSSRTGPPTYEFATAFARAIERAIRSKA